ncbi:PspC domain-containing protein [Plantactinospora sp. DSM 117369]
MTQIPLTQPPYKQLRRPTTDRMIAGVASGLGRYFNVDPTLVRVVFAAIAVFTGGLGLLAYPVLWFLMPEEPADAPAWPHPPGTGPVWPPNWPGRTPTVPTATPAAPAGPPAAPAAPSAPTGVDGPTEVFGDTPPNPRYPA